MADVIVIDAETESEEDLINVGAYSYCAHPSTDVLCASWRPLRAPAGTERLWYPGMKLSRGFLLWRLLGENGPRPSIFEKGDQSIPNDLYRAVKDGAHFHAHNAFFEQSWWALVMVEKYDWPEIPTDRWHCSAAQAAYYGYSQSLERACQGVGTEIAKDTVGSALMKKMAPILKRTKKTIADWESNLYRLGEYCKIDVASEADLILSLPPLPEAEQRIWLLDQKINFRGLPIDRELVEAGAASSRLLQQDAKRRLPALTGGAVTKPGEVARIKKWVAETTGQKLPNLQATTVAQILQKKDTPDGVREVLQIRQDAGTSAIKKFAKEAAAIRHIPDSRFRGGFRHYGAHTGRPTGQIIQPSNMPRAHFKTDEHVEAAVSAIKSGSLEAMASADDPKEGARPTATSTLTKCVRPSITAPDGKTLVAQDWSGIELRVLTWFAGDKKGLTRIVEHGSSRLYLDMADKVFGRKISKDATFEYTVGKAGRLGCGYQMGPYAREKGPDGQLHAALDEYGRPFGGFVEYARNYGIEITPQTLALADKVVKVYRSENPLVVRLWGKCHKAAVETVETGYPQSVHGVRFSMRCIGKGRSMVIRLPSGRELFYPGIVVEERKGRKSLSYWTEKNKKWIKSHIYGGLIVENIVQAMSRDILTPSMLVVDKMYDIVSHCYDEIVTEVNEAEAEAAAEYMAREMCRGLPWTKGLPLDVEGWTGRRYKK
jgi:DNA polymerase